MLIDTVVLPEEMIKHSRLLLARAWLRLRTGIYVLEENLEDPAFVDRVTRVVGGLHGGWKWAEENPEEAAIIVLDYDETGAQTSSTKPGDGRGGEADRRFERGARPADFQRRSTRCWRGDRTR